MAWDRHGNYSRSVRVGEKVRRIYLGRGEVAQLAALLDEQRRSERLARSVAWRAEEARRAVAEAHLGELEGLADLMTRATLMAAGYHKHDRGPWRRRRMRDDNKMDGVGSDAAEIRRDGAARVPDEGETPGDRPLTESELRELLGRAGRGDLTVLPALRRLLDARPALWKYAGDVARHAEAAWIDLLAGGDLLVRESMTRSVAALKAELAGPGAPPLERLLAERVAANRLQASQADAAFAQLKGHDLTAAQVEMCQRRQERAQRSYLEAIKAMVTVRKLTVTAPSVAASATAVDEGAGTRRGRSEGGRQDGVGATVTSSRRKSRGDRKGAGKGKAARGESAVPKALRDRMRGLVEAEN